MIKLNKLTSLLVFQMISPFVIVFIIKVFQLPAEVAGALFILVGFVVLASFLFQSAIKNSAFFMTTLLYLFASIFLFGGNLSHFGHDLSSYKFLSISAVWVHHITETLYLIMIVFTAFEIFAERRLKK